MCMSSISSAASEPSRSDSSERECERSPSARSTNSATASCESTGPMSPSTTTSASSRASGCEQMELLPTSSAEDSRARISPSPGRVPDWTALDQAYGRSTPEFLARFDHNTQSWRILQLCLDGDYQQYSESWPRSGLMRNGTVYALPTLALLTSEIEFGLLPTPSATPYGTTNNGCPQDGRAEYATKGTPSLETM